jgi:hypothetical protein
MQNVGRFDLASFGRKIEGSKWLPRPAKGEPVFLRDLPHRLYRPYWSEEDPRRDSVFLPIYGKRLRRLLAEAVPGVGGLSLEPEW